MLNKSKVDMSPENNKLKTTSAAWPKGNKVWTYIQKVSTYVEHWYNSYKIRILHNNIYSFRTFSGSHMLQHLENTISPIKKQKTDANKRYYFVHSLMHSVSISGSSDVEFGHRFAKCRDMDPNRTNCGKQKKSISEEHNDPHHLCFLPQNYSRIGLCLTSGLSCFWTPWPMDTLGKKLLKRCILGSYRGLARWSTWVNSD